MKLSTILAQAGTRSDERTGALSTPVYQSATFGHPELGRSTGFDYSRTANPTRSVLENVLAQIDSGTRGFAFSSGMAAIDAVCHLFSPGDELIVTEDLYGGTYRYFDKVLKPLGIIPIYVDTASLSAVKAAAGSRVRGMFFETLTNPLLKTADVRALTALARDKNWLSIVDNTFLTPLGLRPLEFGADIVLHSATKYLCGHNDVLAGAVVTANPALAEKIAFFQNAIGAVLGPQDCWLLLRGLKTLPLRIRAQHENALKIARWLSAHSKIRKVLYPGLPSHPGYECLAAQSSWSGAMIGCYVADKALVSQVLARIKVFIFAESLGGVESLATYPLVQTHADIESPIRERLGITDTLLRFSIGIEEAGDLIADLDQALCHG